jgi:hypothetical protein
MSAAAAVEPVISFADCVFQALSAGGRSPRLHLPPSISDIDMHAPVPVSAHLVAVLLPDEPDSPDTGSDDSATASTRRTEDDVALVQSICTAILQTPSTHICVLSGGAANDTALSAWEADWLERATLVVTWFRGDAPATRAQLAWSLSRRVSAAIWLADGGTEAVRCWIGAYQTTHAPLHVATSGASLVELAATLTQ